MKLSSNVSSNTEKQEEKSDGKTQYVEMNENATIPLNFNDDSSRNLTNDATVSFMDLYPFYPIRRIILKNLDFGSQYNLSLIWKDMADEFWCNVDVEKRWRWIHNLEDLEYAGVLASAGYITHGDVLKLELIHVDVSSIPFNIINSLVKIVDCRIQLTSVKGWRTSMLNDANCETLFIWDMKLDSAADKRPFKVLNVNLENVAGDLQGLMDSLTFGPVVPISRRRLVMEKLDISKVPGTLLHSFLKTFKFGIYLQTLTGISSQLFSGIFKHLRFQDIEFCEDPADMGQDINLDIENLHLYEVSGNLFSVFENIKHCSKLHLDRIESSLLTNINMTEIIKEKVESLHLYHSPMPDWLKQYDGDGKCVLIEILYSNDDELYESWARARDWTVEICDVIVTRFSRPE